MSERWRPQVHLAPPERLFHPFPREECLVIVERDGHYTPVCEICHYVGREQRKRSGAKAALTSHRTGHGHRRLLRHALPVKVYLTATRDQGHIA